jgi:zinc transport system substrate-binding protein
MRFGMSSCLAVGLAILLTAGCPAERRAKAPQPAEQRTIVVTIEPLRLLTAPLVAGRASVDTLLEPGANAHTYELRPADAASAARAMLLLWVDPSLDGWAADVASPQRLQVLDLIPAEQLRSMESNGHDHGHSHIELGQLEHAEPQGEIDPHFWTDPLTVVELIPPLVAELSRLDPGGAELYRANGDLLREALLAAHRDTAARLAPVRGQPVLQFHPSFGYLLSRYGLKDAGVIEEFPGREPSAAEIKSIVERIRELDARAVFSETLLPREPAEVVAEAAGVPLLVLDPSCGTSDGAYDTYAEWLSHNVDVLLEGLSR